MERALLVTVGLTSQKKLFSPFESARELRELAESTNACVVQELVCQRDVPTPNFYVGKGKVEEIKQICSEHDIQTVIFNNDLTGTQQRNIEAVLGIKTIDRTQLILDIFSRHAKSPEGKMQVELAQLQYLLPRLTGRGIMLSRLGGGIGTRGPGEQKLEIDRRRISEKIIRLKRQLQEVSERRKTMRKKRQDSYVPALVLVGYTSAGKSTLLNALTQSDQAVSRHLFTTLDPLSRSFCLPNNQKVIVSDTVGFINDLPPHLIDAFKATLEHVAEADLLVHVLDVSDLNFDEHKKVVCDILEKLQAGDKQIATVLNKIDKLDDDRWIQKYEHDIVDSVGISALHKQNFEALFKLIERKLEKMLSSVRFELPFNRMDLVDIIYREGNVLSIEYCSDLISIHASIPSLTAAKLKAYMV